MPIMIPDPISDDVPVSEKIIFETLKLIPKARDWVIFHGIKIPSHDNSANLSKIDFIILIPSFVSVICLKIVGESYNTKHRELHNQSSDGIVELFLTQARHAMEALKNNYETPYFSPDSPLSLGYAVAFADEVKFMDTELPEHLAPMFKDEKPLEYLALMIESSNEVFNALDPYNLGTALESCALKLTEKFWEGWEELTIEKWEQRHFPWEDGQKILDDLRFELEKTMRITSRPERITRRDLETLRPQLLRLTTDQLNSLKRIGINDRCVIDGAAGTGKTVLAMELARQRCEAGETVALLCSNPNLSHRFVKWTKTLSNDNGGQVVASTPAMLPSWIFREHPVLKDRHQRRLVDSPGLEESLKRGYCLDDKWPSFIDETIEDLEEGSIFDYLIVDEAQNLCDEIFLKLMNVLLKGGLADGRWAMFGDFTNQNIVSSRLAENGREMLKNFGDGLHWSNDELETNCRNTHEIATAVAMLADIESLPMSGVHGPVVQIEYFASSDELGDMLDDLIVTWKDRGFESRDIILLSSGIGDEFNTNRSTYGGWRLRNISEVTEEGTDSVMEDILVPGGPTQSSILRYSDVYDFQGLESDLAILVMPLTDDLVKLAGGIALPRVEHLDRVLYTGMSRAKTMLIVVAHESYKEILRDRITSWNLLRPKSL